MNSIKPLATIALLGAVGVGLYVYINSLPEPEIPEDISGNWGSPASVDMQGATASTVTTGLDVSLGNASMPVGGGAPRFGGAPASERLEPDAPSAGVSQAPFDPSQAASSPPHPGQVANPYATPAPLETQPSPGGSAARFGGSAPIHSESEHQHTSSGAPSSPAETSPGYSVQPGPAAGPMGASAYPGPQTEEPETTPTRHATFDEAWTQARQLLDLGELDAALLILSPWHNDPTLRPEEKRELVTLLSQLAGTVIYSTEHHLQGAYQVQPGERLNDIAAKFHVTAELLAKINSIDDPGAIQPGQELKIVKGPFDAVIDSNAGEMSLKLGGRFAGRFDVGIGNDRENIEGQYAVSQKTTNPTYYGRDRVIHADDPDNPLGEHLLNLTKPVQEGISGPFGIHGTNNPGSIPSGDSRGYVRLAPHDAQDVFDILSVGSKVIIRR